MKSSLVLYAHHHSAGVGDTLTRWVAHAAIWRLVSRLPFWLLLIVGAVALAGMFARQRKTR